MKFSTKSEYGLRAIIRIAGKYGNGPYSLAKIAKEEGISLSYLEKLVKKLKDAGLLESTKGVKGGYQLSKKPKEINIAQVLKALEGSLAPFMCVDEKVGCCNKKCTTKKVWIKMHNAVIKAMEEMNLGDLV